MVIKKALEVMDCRAEKECGQLTDAQARAFGWKDPRQMTWLELAQDWKSNKAIA
jgi:hypothetical protein